MALRRRRRRAVPPHRTGPGVPLQADPARRPDAAGDSAAQAHLAASGHRSLSRRVVPPEQNVLPDPERVLPRVVRGGPAGRLPRRHHLGEGGRHGCGSGRRPAGAGRPRRPHPRRRLGIRHEDSSSTSSRWTCRTSSTAASSRPSSSGSSTLPCPPSTTCLLARRSTTRWTVRRPSSSWADRPSRVPTCQLFPPSLPAHRDYCPYTSGPQDGGYHGPDLAKARGLVKASGTWHAKVTVTDIIGDYNPPLDEFFVDVLRSIGYRATLRRYADSKVNKALLLQPRERDPGRVRRLDSRLPPPLELLRPRLLRRLAPGNYPFGYCNRHLDQPCGGGEGDARDRAGASTARLDSH